MEEFILLNEAYEILTNPKFKVKPQITPKPKETKKEAHHRWAREEREHIRKRAHAKSKLKPNILLRKTAIELFVKDAKRIALFIFPVPIFFYWVITSSLTNELSATEIENSFDMIIMLFLTFFLSYFFILLVIARFYFKKVKKSKS